MSTSCPDSKEPGRADWTGPEWDEPLLTTLAHQLRDAHRRVAPLPMDTRRRLTRQLLAITDFAKRDPERAARRLRAFLADFEDLALRDCEGGRRNRTAGDSG